MQRTYIFKQQNNTISIIFYNESWVDKGDLGVTLLTKID